MLHLFPAVPHVAVFDTAFHHTLQPTPTFTLSPTSSTRRRACVATASTAHRTIRFRAAQFCSAGLTSYNW